MARMAKDDDVVEAVEAVEAVDVVDAVDSDSAVSSGPTGFEGLGLYTAILIAGACVWLGALVMVLFWIREYSHPDQFFF